MAVAVDEGPDELDKRLERLRERSRRMRESGSARPARSSFSQPGAAPPGDAPDDMGGGSSPRPGPPSAGVPHEAAIARRHSPLVLASLLVAFVAIAVVVLLFNPLGTLRAESGPEGNEGSQFHQDVYVHGVSLMAEEPVPDWFAVHWWPNAEVKMEVPVPLLLESVTWVGLLAASSTLALAALIHGRRGQATMFLWAGTAASWLAFLSVWVLGSLAYGSEWQERDGTALGTFWVRPSIVFVILNVIFVVLMWRAWHVIRREPT